MVQATIIAVALIIAHAI
ncbi:MAG TPA: hypothetical protein PLF65_08435 [Desulfobacter postgatei]|nr:hypothetical protein [Desulfobacter postgatei]